MDYFFGPVSPLDEPRRKRTPDPRDKQSCHAKSFEGFGRAESQRSSGIAARAVLKPPLAAVARGDKWKRTRSPKRSTKRSPVRMGRGAMRCFAGLPPYMSA